jgi:hypothetical protein
MPALHPTLQLALIAPAILAPAQADDWQRLAAEIPHIDYSNFLCISFS